MCSSDLSTGYSLRRYFFRKRGQGDASKLPSVEVLKRALHTVRNGGGKIGFMPIVNDNVLQIVLSKHFFSETLTLDVSGGKRIMGVEGQESDSYPDVGLPQFRVGNGHEGTKHDKDISSALDDGRKSRPVEAFIEKMRGRIEIAIAPGDAAKVMVVNGDPPIGKGVGKPEVYQVFENGGR